MSRRIAITLAASILLHAGLLTLLLWFSLLHNRQFAGLSDAGGVIWFNLNPGGFGSGGAGGQGAPLAAAPPAQAHMPENSAAKPSDSAAKNDEKSSLSRQEISPQKKARLKITPNLPATSAAKGLEKTPLAPGLPGPGEGDAAGTKTGPGGGEGAGLGPGEGSGSGSGAGPGGAGELGRGGSGKGGNASTILARIRQKIARAKRYPRTARTEGLEGVVGLQFEINPDGSLAYVNLSSGSGHRSLDEEALATVRRAAPFPYYAAPIRFSLRFSLNDQ